MISVMRRRFAPLVLLACAVTGATASAAPEGAVNQRDDGWPKVTGMVLINQFDDPRRILDARPGKDPFGGRDPLYRCDAEHTGGQACHFRLEPCADGEGLCVKKGRFVHNELLGGHNNDTIYAGPGGDILWGDYKPGGKGLQVDRITGGDGRDFIYGSAGRNIIKAGKGSDFIKSRYGRGSIDCGPGNDILYTSRRFRKKYVIRNCERITTAASPGQGGTPTN